MNSLPADFGAKLGAWDPVVGWHPVRYEDLYVAESISGVSRLLVAPSSAFRLLLELLPTYGRSFKLVYLLITPPTGYEPARYEVEKIELERLVAFLTEFERFLGTDARHHIWLHSLESKGGTIIWDEHDWLYLYGHQAALEQQLTTKRFRLEKPEIPFPHLHNESSANDSELVRLLEWLPWVQVPVSNLSN